MTRSMEEVVGVLIKELWNRNEKAVGGAEAVVAVMAHANVSCADAQVSDACGQGTRTDGNRDNYTSSLPPSFYVGVSLLRWSWGVCMVTEGILWPRCHKRGRPPTPPLFGDPSRAPLLMTQCQQQRHRRQSQRTG